MLGAATENARLPSSGDKSCCEVDDKSWVGMLEKCRRLAR